MASEEERVLRAIGRRHRRHQRIGLRRDPDGARPQRQDRQGLRRAQRHHRRADRGPDRHQPRVGRRHRAAALHAFGRVRLVPLQAQVAGSEQARIRAPDRSVPGARHRLLLLQRRRRLGRHLLQGQPVVAGHGLPDPGHPRAQDGGQRPADHRLLPRLRLGRQVRGGLGAGSLVRRALDGQDLDQGVRARGDGPARGLDRGGRRPGPGPRHPGGGAVSRDRVRPGEVHRPRRRAGQVAWLLHRGRVRGLPLPRRQVPGRTRHARRLRPCATGRRGAGGGRHGQAARWATSSTGRWPTTCSARRATSHPRPT